MSFWTDPINIINQMLVGTLTGWGLNAAAANVIATLLGILLLITAAMVLDIMLV